MRVLVNKNNDKQPIHSGHFMVSNFEDETQEEDEVLIPNDPEEALRTESVITFVPLMKRPRLETSKSDYEILKIEDKKEITPKYSEQQYINSECDAVLESKHRLQALMQCECKPVRTSSGSLIHALNLCSGLEIDQSLAKLFQCMSIAYRQKLTSPKWNLFKGMKLSWKDKIRLNNVIWRCWHMQFIFKHPGTIVQFASPLDVDNHCKPEAIVLEGKYWKRRLATVTAEYKKWRIFYKNKIMGRHLSGSDQNLARDLDIPGSSSSVCSRDTSARSIDFFDDEFLAEFSDTLFTSLANNQPYPFPNAREIAKNASIADFIQPGLIQLQPYLDEFNEIEPLDTFGLMNSKFNVTHANMSAIPVLPSLTSTPSRSLETPSHFHSVETPVDSFNAELSPAESQPVDPLETLISTSKTYQRAVEEPYQATVLEGRSRCNSIGKRSYSEFSGSGGMMIVNSPSPVAASEPTLVRSESSREFAVPLLRQRSRSRSGSSKPLDFQSVASSSSLKFSELESPPSQQPITVRGFVPFSKSSSQKEHHRRDESHPFMNNHESRTLQRMHIEMRPSQEEWHTQSVELIKGTSIQGQHPAHSIATPRLTTVSPTQISQGNMRIHQSSPEDRKDSTVLDLLTLGTGLQLQAQSSQKPQTSHLRHPSTRGRSVVSPSKVPAQIIDETFVLSSPRRPVGFNDYRNREAGTQPMDVDVGPCARRSRPTEDPKTKTAEITKPNAPCVDTKKRGTMKSGFDVLHTLIPGIGNQPPNGKNSETSKAAMLHKGAQYITQLRMEREKQLKEIERLKREQKELTNAISHCQSVLPATGAPVSRTNSVARVKGTFDAWVRARTRQNWKFWIFSRLIKPLLESFFNAVDSSSPNEFWCSVFSWIEQYCSLVNLRPAALNTLRELSTKTDILTNPGSMPAYAYAAVQNRSHHEE